MKSCSKCKIEKPLSEFYKDKSQKDGLWCYCKSCNYIKSEKTIKKSRLLVNGLKECLYCYKIKKLCEFSKDASRKDGHQTYCKLCHKKIRINNKTQLNKNRNIYRYKRYKNNIQYKLKENLRSRIWIALQGNIKSLSTMFLIGCEIDYLMYYIQEQFKPDMSWDNYGDWHIDHIKPCASFDLSKPEEQRACFHYTNLQPLWAEDNLRKRDKFYV